MSTGFKVASKLEVKLVPCLRSALERPCPWTIDIHIPRICSNIFKAVQFKDIDSAYFNRVHIETVESEIYDTSSPAAGVEHEFEKGHVDVDVV